jgi:3-oxoacyl-[acyl-carrier protein] reductase
MRSPLELTGDVAVVTGAAQGLGRAEARALARRGARVVVVDRLDASPVADEIREAGGEAVAVSVDVCDQDAPAQILQAALDAFGDLNVLVNNAGVVRDRMSFNLPRDDWDLVLEVNLSAPFFLSQAIVRYWRSLRPGLTGTRSIVNTTSESGLYGNVGQANYSAAKAGVAALTLTLAAEFARDGVRINAVAPRARTPMSKAAFGDLPLTESFDPFAPEHVADVVAWLASDAAADVTGQVLVVHGSGIELMGTWSPRRVLRRESGWLDAELDELHDDLFPDGGATHLAPTVRDLFAAPTPGLTQ